MDHYESSHYNFVPRVADGNDANFVFYFDLTANKFEQFIQAAAKLEHLAVI